MAANVIDEILASESGRIAGDILKRTVHVSPWLDLVQTGVWPDGMGDAIKVLMHGRILPGSTATGVIAEPTWTTIDNSTDYGGAGGSCLPTTSTLSGGHTLAEYQLAHTAIRSAPLCIENVRSAYEFGKQLDSMRENLSNVTKFTLQERFRSQFYSRCTQAVVVKTNALTTGTAIADVSGSGTPGIPTNELLQDYYDKLIFNGSGNSTMLMREDGAPVYPFLTSMQVSRLLKVASGYRDDYRWSPERNSELFKVFSALGAVSKPVFGMQHIIDSTPARWEWTGSEWGRVWPYRIIAGDKGYVLDENPNYLTAAWEDSVIFHPEVYRMLFPNAISSAGGGTVFQPVNYRGEWRWVNVENHDESSTEHNPDRTIGRFRGVFSSASEPLFGNYGVIIRHARCRPQPLYAACS